ncbi:MAG: patatin-like phospholipase family protein [Cyanobacteria bacterium SZAS LIN-5]|nr:patatin-like phospholipase family protein [Cyanobacteria bacterium SZAS LIN-5]
MTSSKAGDSVAASRRKRRVKATESTEVVLGGGAYRGFSHCGLLKAIEELKINTGMITGVSIGSLIATLYTNGYSPEQIEEIFASELTEVPTPSLVRSLLIPAPVGRLFGGTTGGGLIDLPALFSHLIEKYDLKPQPNLRIVAYNLFKREPVVFEGTDYDLLTAVSASCAVPLLMRPVWFGQPNIINKLTTVAASWLGLSEEGVLVDGGVHHPCPGDFCKGTAIIGKLGFATALPRRWLSSTDLIFHALEMVAAPVLGWYFNDPKDHVVIDIGLPDVACMSFGLPRSKCRQMVTHAYEVSLEALHSAIESGAVKTKR